MSSRILKFEANTSRGLISELSLESEYCMSNSSSGDITPLEYVNKINNKAIDPIIILTPSSEIYENVIEPIKIPINEGGIIVAPMIMKNKQVIVKYKKIGNKLESQIYDDVLFVPNLSGTE